MATVFVLEDDPDLLELYTRALTFKGHEVTHTNSAENAIEVLGGDYVPDVAVLDMSMPGLSGAAVVDFLRGRTACAGLPIIVVSCDEDFRERLRSAEVKFMVKPISIVELYQAVASYAA
jgi:CheY-like chemotaxis protein